MNSKIMCKHLSLLLQSLSKMDSNQGCTPQRLLREDSIDANGALSPISSRSNGTDTETEMEMKKKVRFNGCNFITFATPCYFFKADK